MATQNWPHTFFGPNIFWPNICLAKTFVWPVFSPMHHHPCATTCEPAAATRGLTAATRGPAVGQSALEDKRARLTKQEQMLTHIHERLGQDRQRVNLNVRAPKRTMPHQPPIARDIGDERPFPISKFLDEKERQDPS